MSTMLVIVGVLAALVVAFFRALAVDEIRGRIQRRVKADVEATIASLPPELQAEWAEEWRAELATLSSMPFSAIAFARGLRKTAGQLVLSPELAPAGSRARLRPAGVLARLQLLKQVIESRREPEILALIAAAIIFLISLVIAVMGVFTAVVIFHMPIGIAIAPAILLLLWLVRAWTRQ